MFCFSYLLRRDQNNLDIAISEYIAVVGREPEINWYESVDEKVTTSNPKDWILHTNYNNYKENPSFEELLEAVQE